MNKPAATLSGLALFVILASGLGTVGAATPGYAVYQVQVSSMGFSHSLTINETVAATSNPAEDNLILHLVSGNLTLAYSRSINSSDFISPFLPAITNQTFTYAYNGSTVSASIIKSGAGQVQFQGGSHGLTVYSLSASATVNGSRYSAVGTIAAFQSGLVEQVNLTASIPITNFAVLGGGNSSGVSPAIGSSVQANLLVTLLSTSLPLSTGTPTGAAQTATAGVGIGVAASAVAIGLGVRRHNRHSDPSPEVRPEHWVD